MGQAGGPVAQPAEHRKSENLSRYFEDYRVGVTSHWLVYASHIGMSACTSVHGFWANVVGPQWYTPLGRDESPHLAGPL